MPDHLHRLPYVEISLGVLVVIMSAGALLPIFTPELPIEKAFKPKPSYQDKTLYFSQLAMGLKTRTKIGFTTMIENCYLQFANPPFGCERTYDNLKSR